MILPSNGCHCPVEAPPHDSFVVLEDIPDRQVVFLLVSGRRGPFGIMMMGDTWLQVLVGADLSHG